MLSLAAKLLGNLRDDVVFLGGCTTAVFITDQAVPDVRYTLDVDCIIDVISLAEYYKLEKSLQSIGFKKALDDDVICRWRYNELILDVMPCDEKILGFGNRWNKEAINAYVTTTLPQVGEIKTVSAPYFLATKLEAFKTRGKMDFLASHDFEDIISVLDGRSEIFTEITESSNNVKTYLTNTLKNMLDQRAFHDALPGHFLQYGSLANDRINTLVDNIEKMGAIEL